jgi:hypothetical protein
MSDDTIEAVIQEAERMATRVALSGDQQTAAKVRRIAELIRKGAALDPVTRRAERDEIEAETAALSKTD